MSHRVQNQRRREGVLRMEWSNSAVASLLLRRIGSLLVGLSSPSAEVRGHIGNGSKVSLIVDLRANRRTRAR